MPAVVPGNPETNRINELTVMTDRLEALALTLFRLRARTKLVVAFTIPLRNPSPDLENECELFITPEVPF